MSLSSKISVAISTLFMILSVHVYADITYKNLALLINEKDPESIEIGGYYQKARNIPLENIIYLNFDHDDNVLSVSEFRKIEEKLKKRIGDQVQGYVLAWRKPWRVGCMSITSAFTLGFDKSYCANGCKLTKPVEYFNSQSRFPYRDFKIRPSMMLSGGGLNSVKKLIDNGVEADYSRPMGTAYLMDTSDKHRNVRKIYYPLIKESLSSLLKVEIIEADSIKNVADVLFYFTGLKKVQRIRENNYLPGAIADHLTSTGGKLFGGNQMSILRWIDSGVTGSYGTVKEPCNFVHKFPNPGIVMQNYLSGETLIESYWKSVKMPGQGVFVGEPLANPYKGCILVKSKNEKAQFLNGKPIDSYVVKSSKNCN